MSVSPVQPPSEQPEPAPPDASVDQSADSKQMRSRGGQAPTMDSLRLPGPTLEKLHHALDAAAAPEVGEGASSQRKWRRWAIPARTAAATIAHPGGTTVRVLVSPRTLSAGGIGFLHGGFLYPGTSVIVYLRSLTKEMCELRGKVVSCRHIGRHIHHIGVEFPQRIEPRDFLSLSDNENSFLLEKVEPKSLQGRAMVIAGTRTDQRVVSHLLQGTRLEVEYFDDAAAALVADVHSFDLIMVDEQAGGMDGIAAVEKLREAQVMTPTVLFVGDPSREQQQRARDAGVSATITKPLHRTALHRGIAEFLVLRGGLAVAAGAISGNLQGDADMRNLVECFLRDAERLADEIDEALRGGDKEKVRAACAQLQGAGAPHGFPAVSQTASVALTALGQANSLQACANEVRRLVEVCRRCTVG